MTTVHRFAGLAITIAFLVIAIWGLVLRLQKRDEAPVLYRGLEYWTENLLFLQAVTGFAFLIIGRRVVGDDLVFFHYFYGSLFPLIAVVGGRISTLRREQYAYVGMAWGAFFAFGLTTRGLMTGLLERCGSDFLNADCLFTHL